MLMPEAAMNEDDLAARRKYKIGRAREVSPVQTIPVAHPVRHAADCKLGLGVLFPDAPHTGAQLRRCIKLEWAHESQNQRKRTLARAQAV